LYCLKLLPGVKAADLMTVYCSLSPPHPSGFQKELQQQRQRIWQNHATGLIVACKTQTTVFFSNDTVLALQLSLVHSLHKKQVHRQWVL